jgi:hypothetical protein
MSIEAMKQALEALEYEASRGNDDAYRIQREALRTAIAEAEKQEPVAWMFTDVEGTEFFENREDWGGKWTPLYTTPPAAQCKEWQGLTDDEIKEIIGPWGDTPIKGYTRKLFDAIEAKLKEQNHG